MSRLKGSPDSSHASADWNRHKLNQSERRPSPRTIEHVVVLMLENRSFDCMLGRLYPKSSDFDGLAGNESNWWHKPDGTAQEFRVWNSQTIMGQPACIPDPDPGELFDDMKMQIFGLNAAEDAAPNMSGFVDNYMRQRRDKLPRDPKAVMHYFTPGQVPVLSRLARAFGVSDRWHASAPCQTWPNRYFAHCGTAGGHVNNRRSRFPYRWPRVMPTIFNRLDKRGYSWRIYFHDMPQAATLLDLWPKLPTRFCFFDAEFGRHARTGRLATYSFIEPRYYANPLLRKVPNDQLPPHDILYGEQLIADVYNAVRSAPTWKRTLLIITYDEHGGSFDHVPPPAAMPPGGPYPDGFRFNRYGVRVPAVIISPYVEAGSIIRPPSARDGAQSAPFEHSSIMATLHQLFDLGPPLTPRVAAVPELSGVLTLERPVNDGPGRIEVESRLPSFREAWRESRRPRNHVQDGMLSLFTALPALAARAAAHGRRLGAGITPEDWRSKTWRYAGK